jgi:hypothetical protein
MATPEPPNPHDFKKRFHDFIMRRENRGFNASYARYRQDRDDSYVSRMHSPFEPDVKFWLHDAAEQLHKACLASVSVGRFALSMLEEVVAAHVSQEPVCDDELDAAWYHFKSMKSKFAAERVTAEEYDAARDLLVETLGRVRTGARVMTAGEVARDARFGG